MTGFKQPDLFERQKAAAKARTAALEKFRAKAADPTLADRLTARTASAVDRRAAKNVRDVEKAAKKVRDAETAQQAQRDVAAQAERAKAESAQRAHALEAEQKAARDARYAARKARSKRR